MKTKHEIIARNKAIKLRNFLLKGGHIVAEKKTAKDLEELSELFHEVDSKYNKDNSLTKIEGELNLTKLDDVNKTADEISKLAEDSLKEYYSTNIKNINNSNSNAMQDLEKSINTKTENANTLKESINKNYQEVKQDASNDALKRGLARSSIVINKLNAFDNAKIQEYNKIDKELTDSINEINSNIAALNAEKENALSEFNITYAAKLNDKINNLTEELAEKQAEVVKYNNEIAQIEAEYEKGKVDYNNGLLQQDFENTMELNEFIAKYGANALNTVKNNEKYEYAYAYFSTKPVAEAYAEIEKNESNLKAELGNALYNQLKNKFII